MTRKLSLKNSTTDYERRELLRLVKNSRSVTELNDAILWLESQESFEGSKNLKHFICSQLKKRLKRIEKDNKINTLKRKHSDDAKFKALLGLAKVIVKSTNKDRPMKEMLTVSQLIPVDNEMLQIQNKMIDKIETGIDIADAAKLIAEEAREHEKTFEVGSDGTMESLISLMGHSPEAQGVLQELEEKEKEQKDASDSGSKE